MAAHAVTGLVQTLYELMYDRPYIYMNLEAALTLSCWTEELSLETYSTISDACKEKDKDELWKALLLSLCEMIEEWADLGCPNNREAWLKRKYQIPITGVVHNNTPKWLYEELYNAIDLDFEEHCEECPNENHDECWESIGTETLLIGDWKLEGDQYIPDEGGESGYAAIVGEINTQVVWSIWTKRCAPCSPCYPEQGDLDTPGDLLTYDLPPEVYGGE